MPDPIEMLMQDHREVEQLFARYEQTKDPAVVEQICTELTVHAAAEEKVIYPALGADVTGGKGMRQHAEKEHQEVKDAIFEIERLGYTDPAVEQFMQTIIEGVNHHVEEEESEMFPKLQEELGARKLTDLGKKLADAKQKALRKETGAGGHRVEGDLASMTKDQLYEQAKKADIEGRSDMTKDELVKALARQ